MVPVTAKKTLLNDAILKRNEKSLHVRHYVFVRGISILNVMTIGKVWWP